MARESLVILNSSFTVGKFLDCCPRRGKSAVNDAFSVKDRFPVDEVTVSVDQETGKSVLIKLACLYRGFGVRKKKIGMSVPGFRGPQT